MAGRGTGCLLSFPARSASSSFADRPNNRCHGQMSSSTPPGAAASSTRWGSRPVCQRGRAHGLGDHPGRRRRPRVPAGGGRGRRHGSAAPAVDDVNAESGRGLRIVVGLGSSRRPSGKAVRRAPLPRLNDAPGNGIPRPTGAQNRRASPARVPPQGCRARASAGRPLAVPGGRVDRPGHGSSDGVHEGGPAGLRLRAATLAGCCEPSTVPPTTGMPSRRKPDGWCPVHRARYPWPVQPLPADRPCARLRCHQRPGPTTGRRL